MLHELATCASSSMSLKAGCCNDRLSDGEEIGMCHMV